MPSNVIVAAVGLEQPQQHPPERRLAAARLAHQPEHLARADVEVDAVDGLHDAPGLAERAGPGDEGLDHAASLEQDVARRCVTIVSDATAHGHRRLGDVGVEEAAHLVPRDHLDERRAAPRCTASRPASTRAWHRAAKRQPGGRSMRFGTRPGITVSSSAAPADHRHGTDAAPGCRDAGARANNVAVSVSSTIWPAYITATRSHISATTPRSWVISTIAMPSVGLQLAHQVEDLRLDGDVERRRRLVGDQQLGLGGQRHGDHHPLRLPARQLVRVAVGRAAAASGMWTWRSISTACSRPTRLRALRWIS